MQCSLLLQNRYVRDYLLITNLVFMALVPLAVLIGVNARLYRLLRHRSFFASASFHANASSNRGRRTRRQDQASEVTETAAAAASPPPSGSRAALSARARRDRAIAGMFIVIVCVFVCCHSLKLVVTFYEMCRVSLSKFAICARAGFAISLHILSPSTRTFCSGAFFIHPSSPSERAQIEMELQALSNIE